MASYDFEWSATDKHLIAIGKVVIESASIEMTLQLAIWQILRVPTHMGSYITGHLQLSGRINLFQDIAPPILTKTAGKNLGEVLEEIRQVVTDRNTIVHGLWDHGADKPPLIWKYKKESQNGEKSYRLRHRKWTPKMIEDVASKIAQANENLCQLLLANGIAPPEQPNTPSQPY